MGDTQISSKRFTKKQVIALGTLLGLLLVVFGVMTLVTIYYPAYGLKGTIYLTLESQTNDTESGFYSNIYTLKRPFKKLNELTRRAGESQLSGDLSSGGSLIAMSVFADSDDTNSQIYTYDIVTGVYRQITRSDTSVKQFPKFSPNDTKIAFVGISDLDDIPLEEIIAPVERFEIYITDLNGNETFITNGMHPQWLPDGRLLVLKNDGLHIFTEDGRDIEHIWESVGETGVLSNTTIDLAEDGSRIAWAAPDWGSVEILDVESWNPYTSEEQTSIPTDNGLFGVVFSPDARKIAGYELSRDGSVRDLVVYDTDTLGKSTLRDLNFFPPRGVIVTDWR